MKNAAAHPGWFLGLAAPFLWGNLQAATAEDDRATVLGGSVAIATDYVFRGVSQTLGEPALQASIDLALENGFYAYVWGSNVDFYPAGEPSDGAHTEINLAAGYFAEWGERWSLDVMLVRYLFPGTRQAIDYDYTELISTVRFDDQLHATLGYSNAVEGTDSDSWFTELGFEYSLPSDVMFGIAWGRYDLSDAYGSSYSYTSTTLSRQFSAAEVGLSYYKAFDGADELYFEQAFDSRIVFSVLVTF